MQISWLGQSCFKIQSKDVTLVADPYEDKIGLKLPRLQANIVTISHNHYDHNNLKAVGGQPFVIDAPGEYEINQAFIWGIPSWHDDKEGAERGPNIIFIYKIEDIKIAHLGDLGAVLTDEQNDKLEGVDILFIPVGGIYTLDAKKAAEVVGQIEPRLVIPMHYRLPGLKVKIDGVEKFCSELGVKPAAAEDKLKITKKELPVNDMKIVILKP